MGNEIKKKLKTCVSETTCVTCPYGEERFECMENLLLDAVEYIEQLEERIAIMTEGKEGE